MTLDEATETTRRTASTRHIMDRWGRIRAERLHDDILALLADPPEGVGMLTRMRLSKAAAALRVDLDRMGHGR